MSDLNLFSLGCVVSFIALAGAYVYLRESYARHQQASEDERSLSATELTDERNTA